MSVPYNPFFGKRLYGTFSIPRSSNDDVDDEASTSSNPHRDSITIDPTRRNDDGIENNRENREQSQAQREASKFRRSSLFDRARNNTEGNFSRSNENSNFDKLGPNPFNRKRRADSPSARHKVGKNNKKPCSEMVQSRVVTSLQSCSVNASESRSREITPISEEIVTVDIEVAAIEEVVENVPEVIDLLSDSEEEETAEEMEFLAEMSEIERFSRCDSVEEKVEEMKRNAEVVEYHEWAEYRKAGDAKARIIEKNPILKENIDREVKWNLEHKVAQSQAIRLYEHLGVVRKSIKEKRGIVEKFEERPLIENTSVEMKKKCRKVFKKEIRSVRYVPPRRRIRIMRNLSLNTSDKIPVFCDLPIDENRELCDIEIPKTLAFDFIEKNDTSREDHPGFDRAIEVSENPENWIVCGCEPDETGKLTKCSENPKCRCYKLNRKLMERQKIDIYRQEKTEYSTFGKVFVRDLDHFFDSVAFSCSELCGCRGCCDNNLMYTIEQKVNSFEVYRSDAKGFAVRATSFIPHGSPVMEFTGEISEHRSVAERGSVDYAFATIRHDGVFKKWLLDNCDFNKDYAKQIEKMYKAEYEWFIDPKEKGNHARFVTHGCHPNLAMIRMFQVGFLPHQCRAVMISSEDIWPGTELTFDYGPNYVEQQLKGKCLCGTIGCVGKEDTLSTLMYAPWHMMYQYYLANHDKRKDEYRCFIQERKDPESWLLEVREDSKRRIIRKELPVQEEKNREEVAHRDNERIYREGYPENQSDNDESFD